MFTWFKTASQETKLDDPKALTSVFATARNGQCEKALGRFKQCDVHTRATILQEAAFLPVSEGLAKLMAYAMHHEPDSYVRSVAKRVTDARTPLRMQALQIASELSL